MTGTLMSRRTFNRAATAMGVGAIVGKSSTARAATTTLVLSHHLPTSHLIHRTSERFAALVAEATKGEVAIDIKPNSSLFNLRSGADACASGQTICTGRTSPHSGVGVRSSGSFRCHFCSMASITFRKCSTARSANKSKRM